MTGCPGRQDTVRPAPHASPIPVPVDETAASHVAVAPDGAVEVGHDDAIGLQDVELTVGPELQR